MLNNPAVVASTFGNPIGRGQLGRSVTMTRAGRPPR